MLRESNESICLPGFAQATGPSRPPGLPADQSGQPAAEIGQAIDSNWRSRTSVHRDRSLSAPEATSDPKRSLGPLISAPISSQIRIRIAVRRLMPERIRRPPKFSGVAGLQRELLDAIERPLWSDYGGTAVREKVKRRKHF